MRDIALVMGLFILIPMIFKRPYVGALVWTWIAISSLHREAYGFSSALRPNLLIVVVTLIAFILSTEPKKWPSGKLAMSFVVFMLWTTLTAIISPDPATSLEFYSDFVLKMAMHMIIILVLINSEHRLISLLWVYALSLGYHAVKIALVTVSKGFVIGNYRDFGPKDTMIDDRNHFALAMLMLAPVLFFLWKYASRQMMRYAAMFGMLACFLSVIGSFSRGGLITMFAMLLFLWTKTRNKIFTGALMGIFAFAGISLVPAEYTDRIRTVFEQGGQETRYEDERGLDDSFCGRVATWTYGFDMVKANPIFGTGLRSIQNEDIARPFMSFENPCSEDIIYKPRAAHNIYMEVMTDSGFVGLGMFLFILVGSWFACSRIAWRCRRHPELQWARDLAMMIQVSLTGYAIGGMLLSLAYFDAYYLLVCMVIILWRLVDEKLGVKPPRRIFEIGRGRSPKGLQSKGRRPKPA